MSEKPTDKPTCIVVMGVSGCGKSTLGEPLARALDLEFVEGDSLHSQANIDRMAAGIALTDADRRDWLHALAAQLARAGGGGGVVMTCSALKRNYRDILRGGCPLLQLVHMHGSVELLAERMRNRPNHYMPASLLQSQLDALQMPTADERVLSLDIALPLDEQLALAVHHFQGQDPSA
ncbi:MAG: gluconokinase [Rubrivivax sp.]